MKRSGVIVLAALGLCCYGSLAINAQEEVSSRIEKIEMPSTPLQPFTDMIPTQHYEIPTLLNPAATGEIDYIRIRAGGRLDWLGLYHAPKNFFATGDMPFKIGNKRIGAGLLVNSESYDLYRNLLISAQGSYKFKIKSSVLSVGLQIGYYHTKFRGSEFTYSSHGNSSADEISPDDNNQDNPQIPDEGGAEPEPDEDYEFKEMPTQDIGAGVFDVALGIRFQHPKFYVGLSALHLTNPTLKLSTEGESASDTRYFEKKLPMTLYFEGGGNIPIHNSLFTLQPSLVAGTDFSDFAAVLDLRATYNRKITFGLDYRWNRAFGLFAGMYIKNFYVGYSWEYDYTPIAKNSTGNHELVLGYQFKLDMGGKNTFRHRSIRIM